MKLNKRWMTVLIVSGLLISALVAAFAFTGSRTPVAAAASSAQTSETCVDDDAIEAPGEQESQAGEAGEAEDADCPGDVEDD
jgi:hypothetical protein